MGAVIREKLVENVNHARKMVDIEWVYGQIDQGRTVKSIAEELNVSETTIRRRYHAYQNELVDEKTDVYEDTFVYSDDPIDK